MPLGAAAAISISGVSISAAGWFASPLVSKLLQHTIFKNWEKNIELEEGLKKEIKRLHAVLPQIKSFTEVAEGKQFENSGVRDWVRELKDVLYDAEDVLDLYEVEAELLLLKKQRDAEAPFMEMVSTSFSSLLGNLSSTDDASSSSSSSSLSVAEQIKAINERLDVIRKAGLDFGLKDIVLHSAPPEDSALSRERRTSSIPENDESSVAGRDGVREEMIELLVPAVQPGDDQERILVLAIVGMGGLGKTTLAQLLFNDERVVNSYKSRAWVCVGQSYNLDPIKTTASIIESARAHRREEKPCKLKDLDALQKVLKDEIKEPFLLVLDDAWAKNKNVWKKLLAPLRASKKRCRVIVTTREWDEEVAAAFPCKPQVKRLGLLDADSMWSIFKEAAFDSENEGEYPTLEPIGKEIVQRLRGLPLAAKTVGGILLGKSKAIDWIGILNSEQLLNRNKGNDFMRSVLMLSYYSLGMDAKQYFSCFSLFPKDYEFEYTSNGVLSEKFYENKKNKSRMIGAVINLENNASDCVHELRNRSLLQYTKDEGDNYVSMHDLIHDMAELVSEKEFIRICTDASKKVSIPEKIRHISVFDTNFGSNSDMLLNGLQSYKSLRTLLYVDDGYPRETDFRGLLRGWFENLRHLRVLSLDSSHIKVLPDSIGNLKLLRYLDLNLPEMEELPSTISRLQKLLGLDLLGCDSLRGLPSSVTELINLIHLDVKPELLKALDGIGQLTNLQTLEEFDVEEGNGHGISELENMNGLCGSLSISSLEKVRGKENAEQARLDQKTKLERLDLSWKSREGSQADVLEELRPHKMLNELTITRYCGTHLPNWLTGTYLISLSVLVVDGCPKLEEIPSYPRTLRCLELSGNTKLKSLFSPSSPISPPSLQRIDVPFCYELDGSLNSLLEASSSSLKHLDIGHYSCPLRGLSRVTTLSELSLRECTEEVVLNRTALISLTEMAIYFCPHVVVSEWHPSDPEIVSSLTSLRVYKSPVIESLSGCKVLLTSLTYLSIHGSKCDDSALSRCLFNATALKGLCLSSCSNITTLPPQLMHRLAAIEELTVYDCPELVELACPPVANIEINISDCPKIFLGLCPPISTPAAMEYLDVKDLNGGQPSRLLSAAANTPIRSNITLRSRIITDDAAAPMLRGTHQDTTLKVLTLSHCKGPLPLDLSSLESLEKLTISSCSDITSLPVLSALTDLHIAGCCNLAFTFGEASPAPLFPKLRSLRASTLNVKQLTDLINGIARSPIEQITIRNCRGLKSFDDGLQLALLEFKKSMSHLAIEDVFELTLLPTNLEAFEALYELKVQNCPCVLTLPNGRPPASLQSLVTDSWQWEKLHEQGHQWFSGISSVIFHDRQKAFPSLEGTNPRVLPSSSPSVVPPCTLRRDENPLPPDGALKVPLMAAFSGYMCFSIEVQVSTSSWSC